MNELHRQAYLDAMGVDVYFPRLLLPAAPLSVLCEISPMLLKAGPEIETDTEQAAVFRQRPDSENKEVAGQSRAAAMQALLGEIPRAPLKPQLQPRPASSAKTESNLQRQSLTPRFTLSVTCVGKVIIIDDAAPDDVLEFRRLQQNFLSAIGLVTDSQDSNFKWPIVESSHLDQSESAAKQTVRAFVQNQLKNADCESLLLMGETACNYLLDDEPVMGEWLATFVADVPVLCAPSLVASFGSEQLKSQIWQAVKPLRKKLSQ